MERLALLMDELFSLSISEGAICNILARARALVHLKYKSLESRRFV
jgi:hypothetical protein